MIVKLVCRSLSVIFDRLPFCFTSCDFTFILPAVGEGKEKLKQIVLFVGRFFACLVALFVWMVAGANVARVLGIEGGGLTPDGKLIIGMLITGVVLFVGYHIVNIVKTWDD